MTSTSLGSGGSPNSNNGNKAAYDPVFTTLCKENATSPLFSLALSRNEGQDGPGSSSSSSLSTSYIAFGGVPPTVQYDDSTWARTPIEPLPERRPPAVPPWPPQSPGSPGSFAPPPSPPPPNRGLYVIRPTAWIYSRRTRNGSISTTTASSSSVPPSPVPAASIDAGSTLTILPSDMADALLSAFDPPPHWVVSGQAYYAPCNARVPTLGVQIGTQVFYMAAADILRQGERDAETGRYCRVGITDGAGGLVGDDDTDTYGLPMATLGVTFLTNVIAVFDIGNGEMRFASRRQY